MLWVAIILGIGCLVLLIEQTLGSILIWLESRGIIKKTCQEWFINETLQLQRLAHEELGLGEWESCTGSRVIPVTRKDQLLGTLDCTDPKHPRLVNSAAMLNESTHGGDTDEPSDLEGRIENSNASIHEEPLHSAHPEGKNESSTSSIGALSSEATRYSMTAPVDGRVETPRQSPVRSASQSSS